MFLGLDIGTSGVKAVIIDDQGQCLAQSMAPLAVSRPRSGWSEQNPADWWQATCAAVGALDSKLRRGVEGVGLAGQMHGATLLDASDTPLRPAILWNDGRSQAQCAYLETIPSLRRITGNAAMPGFTAPKLLWLHENEPEIFAATRTILLPKDYVRLLMTGEKISDMSDAAGTLWLDVAARDWSDAMLDASHLSRRQMPRLVEGSAPAGRLRADVASSWGVPAVSVAGGGGDNAAGAVGVGAVQAGDALLSLGTSGVIFVVNDRFRPNPAGGVHAFCHCLPGLWHQMSVHLSAASCLDWAARLVGAPDVAGVLSLAEATGASAGPELFLPYLGGERTPHNDADIRGAFLRLDHDTDRGRLAQAVFEGVAFALADGLSALRDAGTHISRLSVIGGGARSRTWCELIAAALDLPLDLLQGGETGPALGAARLAQLAVAGGSAEAVCTRPPLSASIMPDARTTARLAPKLAAFRRAYPALSALKDHASD